MIFGFQGFMKVHSSIASLISQLSIMPELTPLNITSGSLVICNFIQSERSRLMNIFLVLGLGLKNVAHVNTLVLKLQC